jgi:hypothetical protein
VPEITAFSKFNFNCMKKLKIAIVAFVMTIGIGGAFAGQSRAVAHSSKFVDTWQDTDVHGNLILTSQGGQTYATKADAETATGCSSGSQFCAASVNHPDGTETGSYIKKN